MTTAVATTNERSTKLASYLDTKADDFRAVMVIEPDRFMRMVKNAIIKDPLISEASTQSVFLEIMKAAADGLVLDGREATLTRFKSNKRVQKNGQWVDNWQTEVAYIPMVAGIMKRVRNSGEVAAWTANLVYANEYETGRFSYVAAPVADLRHEPLIVGDRGPVIAAYSAVKLKDGSFHYEVMTKDQLDGIKNRTKSKKQDGTITGPWATDEEEMYKKTVIRRHSKRLPVSSELLDITQRVDALYDREEDAYTVQGTVPKPVATKQAGSAASRLKAAAEAARVVEDDEGYVGPDYAREDKQERERLREEDALEGEVIEPEKPAKGKASAPQPDDEF